MLEKDFKLTDLKEVADQLLSLARKSNLNQATILTFSGDLGAGKTTITQEIAKSLGVKDKVISPTFVIMKIYRTKDKKFTNLIHIDAYRLSKGGELMTLGFGEMIKDKSNLIIIEWPEIVADIIPEEGVFKLELSHKNESTRSLKFWYN